VSPSTTATLALYGVVLAGRGRPQASRGRGVNAPEAEIGLAVLLAAAVVRTAPVPRAIAYLMAPSGLTYLLQGWRAGAQGFSPHTQSRSCWPKILSATWMIWLLVVAGWIPLLAHVSPRR
jgi:hypothetical protein